MEEIHPAESKEVVAKTEKNIEEEIVEIGEELVSILVLHGYSSELIRMVRSNENIVLLTDRPIATFERSRLRSLHHGECRDGFLECLKMAKRAGLLHDIW